MSSHLFPPSIPEWHGFVVGFGGGFVYGSSPSKSRGVVVAALLIAFGLLAIVAPNGGHLHQALKELAYTTFGFIAGAIAGRLWRRRRS